MNADLTKLANSELHRMHGTLAAELLSLQPCAANGPRIAELERGIEQVQAVIDYRLSR